MIKVLLFDFGRVISAPKPRSLFHKYEKDLGLEPDTINTIMFESPLWQQALTGMLGMDEYWAAIGPQLNLFSRSAIQRFQKKYYEDERVNLAVLDIIEQLSKSFTLAIVSNHPPGLMKWLEAWNIDHLFEMVICSGDEGIAKPDPAIFILSLKHLGVSAQETFFIDDTLEHILAARTLGIHAHHFVSARQLILDLQAMGINYGQSPRS